MTVEALIPVGRTSMVSNGTISFQVQTEYAGRPYPRVTTSVLHSGQVVHKVEHKLEQAVASHEDVGQTELVIKQQHQEVKELIESNTLAGETEKSRLPVNPQPTRPSIYDRLKELTGFRHYYRLSVDGAFRSENMAYEFKRIHRNVYKDLPQILELFPFQPGGVGQRATGVCELVPDALYFVSTGLECYFIEVKPDNEPVDYESELKTILIG